MDEKENADMSNDVSRRNSQFGSAQVEDSAKGQEWKSVFLLNTVDGCLPSDLATGSMPEIEKKGAFCTSP
jgi:superfamily I DNA/RNA helicase